MANKISEITRRNIFDFIQVENFWWSGRLEEIDFLSRIYNLEEMESYDSRFENAAGDIWQHRINNNDWKDNWIFYDDRFNLMKCDDSRFLNFLCEMIHPIVRADKSEVSKLLQIFNDNLQDDNFELVEKTKISGRPIFVGRMKITGKESLARKTENIRKILNAEYVTQQINLMETSIENSPHIAIGLAKELIETCCKSIFEERKIEYEKSWDLPKLMKETTKLLKLTPEDISDEVKAAKSIKQILGSLSSVVQGIGEIRNEYGSGHGKDGKFKGLQPRHAKLAVGAASTLAIYLLETHELRK
ncbi:abortive infection Abi-like protein [Christiangramia gaetbulicola]|uniref:Abortive infection Abi-like protein n=1 Tax=Christiangramia gaetbulicola TaxID=703340 RepID=A0A2T6AI00_9FLAO|nr:abortive infection family protein [Christiangramia gaetbulicola]PTX43436.1 abortive infection Abi-like protein [Christiangramia gaetbulicola]